MDPLSGLFDGPRARGAFLLRSLLDPPWSLRIQDEAPLTVVALVRGAAWVLPDDDPPAELGPGDLAILRGPSPYTVADQPSTAPQVVIHPGQRCTTLDGEPLHDAMHLGVRTWGTSPQGAAMLLTGTYESDGEVGRRLLDALPLLTVLRRTDWDHPVLDLLTDEIGREAPGQGVVLDRLLDVLVLAAIRAWLSRPEARAPSWYLAQSDPVVGKALQRLHDDPARGWTVAALAADVGVSRAGLARRFTELVGEPPIGYLASWRLTLAADLLREPGATVTSVARHVGYGSPFTFSTAFKRRYGASPRQYRDGVPTTPEEVVAGDPMLADHRLARGGPGRI